MNRRLGKTPFAELLPSSIAADPAIKAAAEALDGVIGRLTAAIPDLLIFARLENDSGFVNPVPMLPPMERLVELEGALRELPPKLLDLLAWQLHVESYDTSVSLDAKRAMLQNSLLLHRRHGTPWSVRHALETLLEVPATIPQWFEYGGKPYFFKARLNVAGVAVDMAWIISALQIIMDYKNVRSWLEVLETFSENPLPVFAAMATASRTMQGTRLWIRPENPPDLPVKTGMAISGVTKYFPSPNPPRGPQNFHKARIAFSGQTITRSYLCPKY